MDAQRYTVEVNGVQLRVCRQGTGSETILMCHGLLMHGGMFDGLIDALAPEYQCVTVDFRGQGQSEVVDGGYDLSTLSEDIIAVIEQLDLAPCHLLGFSMGGMVAQRVALRRPELLRSLILLSTSAAGEPMMKHLRYGALNVIARTIGLKAVAPKVGKLLFSDAFNADPRQAEKRKQWMAMILANDRIGVTRAVRGVISRRSILNEIDQINVPTLVIGADQDRATPPQHSRDIAARIASAQLVMLTDSGHTTPAEQPTALAAAVGGFLTRLKGDR